MVVTMIALSMGCKGWRRLRAVDPSLWGWGQVPEWRLGPPSCFPPPCTASTQATVCKALHAAKHGQTLS